MSIAKEAKLMREKGDLLWFGINVYRFEGGGNVSCWAGETWRPLADGNFGERIYHQMTAPEIAATTIPLDDIADATLRGEVEAIRAERTPLGEKLEERMTDLRDAAKPAFVPTPHEPVEGVTLWQHDQAPDGGRCLVRVAGVAVSMIDKVGNLCWTEGFSIERWHEPNVFRSFAKHVDALAAFRDRIRASRLAAASSSPQAEKSGPSENYGTDHAQARVCGPSPRAGRGSEVRGVDV